MMCICYIKHVMLHNTYVMLYHTCVYYITHVML